MFVKVYIFYIVYLFIFFILFEFFYLYFVLIVKLIVKFNLGYYYIVLLLQFLLAASDICTKLKMFGYWADFINPFSGQPYLNPHKNGVLYKTDERFRCLGFKVDKKNACKVVTYDNKGTEFIGKYKHYYIITR